MNSNSALGYSGDDIDAIREAFGITNFIGNTGFYQTIGGLIIQIGKTSAVPSPSYVDFHVGFPKQAFGVWLQEIYPVGTDYGHQIDQVSTTRFRVIHPAGNTAYYWLAIGV